MHSFNWERTDNGKAIARIQDMVLHCDALKGLSLTAGHLHLNLLLGLEVVDAINLGPQPLASPGSIPDMIIRQNTLTVQYAPTTKRPVECQARWQLHPEGIIDLEVSTLTPGKWDGLAVQTRTQFKTQKADVEVVIDESVKPAMLIYRPMGLEISYAEFCHPQDGIELYHQTDSGMTTTRFRLFGHDLEKGVILRGRLRSIVVPRAFDMLAAHAARDRFMSETPNLAL
ncbi:MAG: hypothetical protein JNJ77_09200 [Planctomycetia bacterium]|nr:hypothetical protein [Planctomycetia bacterium]